MSARTDSSPAPKQQRDPLRSPVVLRADDISVVDSRGVVRVRRATLEVRAGELVGLVGVEGAGHRELLRVLAGRLPATSGTLEVPNDVGFVPEDRQHDAVLLDFPLTANVALRGAGTRRGRMRWARWEEATRELLATFDVRAAGPGSHARTLSGGNQQKLVLARELLGVAPYASAATPQAVSVERSEALRTSVPQAVIVETPQALTATVPQAVIVENPSRGLDIRATAEVRRRLREARDAGAAVIVYSSDVDEALTLADRLLVMHAGEVREVALDRDLVARALVGAL